jgi:hypothetical protein
LDEIYETKGNNWEGLGTRKYLGVQWALLF